jgi:hypothetical protein
MGKATSENPAERPTLLDLPDFFRPIVTREWR